MCHVIPVNGHESGAKVDREDFERVTRLRWYAWRSAGLVYARSTRDKLAMHRFVLGDIPSGMVVDHINGDGLDNRRSNLRICTQRENSRNRGAKRGFRGVSWKADIGRWRARIMVDRREISLGAFDTQESAAAAYNEAAIEHYGAFARLNIIPIESRV